MNFLDYIANFDKHTFKPKSEIKTKFKIKDIFKDNWYNFVEDTHTLNIRHVLKDEVEKMISYSSFLPMFDCENCNGQMRPVSFVGHI